MRWNGRAVSRLARNITGPMRNGKSGSWSALSQPWQCAFCGSNCRLKAKVCGQCGLRRAAGHRGLSKTSTSNPGLRNSATVTTDGTKQTEDTCGQRASLSACIKTLENTLAALPEGGPFESTRVYLQKETSEKKKEITESKPWAMRLVSCTVRPSVDSCVWREVPKRVRCHGHQPSLTQQSVYWDNVPWERDKLHVAQLEQLDSHWHHLHQFVSNGKEKAIWYEKRQVT